MIGYKRAMRRSRSSTPDAMPRWKSVSSRSNQSAKALLGGAFLVLAAACGSAPPKANRAPDPAPVAAPVASAPRNAAAAGNAPAGAPAEAAPGAATGTQPAASAV